MKGLCGIQQTLSEELASFGSAADIVARSRSGGLAGGSRVIFVSHIFSKVLGDSQQDASVSQMAKSHTCRHTEIRHYIYRQTHENTDGHVQTYSHIQTRTGRDNHRHGKGNQLNQSRDLSCLHSCIPSPPNSARYVNNICQMNK